MIAIYAVRSAFRSRHAHLVVLGVATLGILAPQSRGAWAGVLLGLVVYQIFRKQVASLGWWTLYGATAFLVVIASSSVSDRVTNTLGINSGPDYRVSLFSRGVEEIKNYPIIGRPMDQVYYSLRDLIQGEGQVDFVNTYLYVALVSGLIGLTVFIAVLVWPLLPLWARRSDRLLLGRDQQQIAFVFSAISAMIFMLSVSSLVGRSMVLISITMAFSAAIMNYRNFAGRRAHRERLHDVGPQIQDPSKPTPLPAA